MAIFSSKGKTLSTKELDELYSEASKVSSIKKIELTKDEVHQKKKDNRFYLPVLGINKPQNWPPKPKSEREYLTDEKAYSTCVGNCCGVEGLKSACCTLDPQDLEHILGPIPEDWIKHAVKFLSAKTGFKYTRHDIVIDFEEGKIIGRNFFNNHRVFFEESSYPMLRFKVNGPRFSCNFMNVQTGLCTIYTIRPEMCKNYLCSYIKSNFFVKHNNQWIMPTKE